jgi:hypothetical protein
MPSLGQLEAVLNQAALKLAAYNLSNFCLGKTCLADGSVVVQREAPPGP